MIGGLYLCSDTAAGLLLGQMKAHFVCATFLHTCPRDTPRIHCNLVISVRQTLVLISGEKEVNHSVLLLYTACDLDCYQVL